MAKNYYAILGLTFHATEDEIRDAYRRLAKEFHPDHYGGDRQTFLDIQEAYSTLSVPSRKRAYDANIARRPVRSYRSPGPYGLAPEPGPLMPEGRPTVLSVMCFGAKARPRSSTIIPRAATVAS